MAYSYFGCCENHKFNLFHSISSSLHDIVQASLAFHSSVQPKYVMNNLVICENRVNTHTFSSRVFYRKYLKYQNISKPREEEISNFSGFANRFLRLIYAMVLRPSVWRLKKHCIIILRRYQSALTVPCWKRRIFFEKQLTTITLRLRI